MDWNVGQDGLVRWNWKVVIGMGHEPAIVAERLDLNDQGHALVTR